MSESNGVTNADIDQALRELRQESGGREPYAMAVYPRAREIAARRQPKPMTASEAYEEEGPA